MPKVLVSVTGRQQRSRDPLLLLHGDLGEERQAEQFAAVRSARETARGVPQPGERGSEVYRYRIVDSCADAHGVQLLSTRSRPGDPHRVQMPDMFVAVERARPNDGVATGKHLVVPSGRGPPGRIPPASRRSFADSTTACSASSLLLKPSTSCWYFAADPWSQIMRIRAATSADPVSTAPASPYAPRFLPG